MNFYIGNSMDEINPYVDVEISKNDLSQIIEICNYILDTSLLRLIKNQMKEIKC